MLKPTTFIMKPRYLQRKQIKTNYKVQSLTDPMLNDEIE